MRREARPAPAPGWRCPLRAPIGRAGRPRATRAPWVLGGSAARVGTAAKCRWRTTVVSVSDQIDGLIDEWMAAELAESPERATTLGIEGHDDHLSDLSAAGFARRAAADD